MRELRLGHVTFDYRATACVKKLIWINISIWILAWATGSLLIYEWFSFQPYKILVRPWGVFTYMFVHGGFWHVFSNMLLLFFLGPPLERLWGSKIFLRYFLVCGLGGAALSYAFVTNSIIGASAGIYGIMLAFALTWPNVPMYIWGIFPVKVKWLVSFMFLVTFSSVVNQAGDGIAHFAHLGGFISGFVFLPGKGKVRDRIGKFWSAAQNSSLGQVSRRSNLKLVGKRESVASRKKTGVTLNEVDVLLDKIAKRGMSSLTEQEKELLYEVAKKRQSH